MALPSQDELAVHHFFTEATGPEIHLKIPAGLKPYPLTVGEWYLRVLTLNVSSPVWHEGAIGAQGLRILALESANVRTEDDRPLYLACFPMTGRTGITLVGNAARGRYFRLRPASEIITFHLRQLAPIEATAQPWNQLLQTQILVELVQRRPK